MPNLIHVLIFNSIIRYKLRSILKHGIRGTNGTLNDKFSTTCGSLHNINMEIIKNAIEIPIMIVSNNFKKPSQPLTFVIQMQNTTAANV